MLQAPLPSAQLRRFVVPRTTPEGAALKLRMTKLLLLVSSCGMLAFSAAAQDTPPTRPTDGQGNWLTFDKPVRDSVARPVLRQAASAPRKTTMGTVFVPLDADVYRLIDRYALKYGADSLGDPHTSVRPYTRAAVARLAERILQDSSAGLSRQDRFNVRYLLRDNWHNTRQDSAINERERPILKYFYQRPSDLYSVETPDFSLRVNPVAGLQLGRDSESDGLRYLNTRGVQVEGTIDERLGFYTFLTDNQMSVPLYVQQRVQRDTIVPHEGYWKPFKNQPDQYDFLTARGYLTYAISRHVSARFGHDRNVIGNGYRSLILSDYSAPYLFLQLNTRIWKFNYQNLFAELTADRRESDQVFPKKYMALHHLSLDLLPNLNVGVFETALFARGRGRFELQYLNPIIFYRSVEQQIGSEDNALLGLDFKWNIRRRLQLYGQLMLDEFVISEVRSGTGSWRNKQAFQLGGRYIDVAGIRNLDLQGEFNYVRPYTYQHEDRFRNFQHYQQPLAHPMGANLWELVGIVSYQPLPRLHVVAKGFLSEQGLDNLPTIDPEPNYGGNVLKPYTTRLRDDNNRVGQGNRSRLLHLDLTATWQAAHNLWLDGKLIARRQTYEFPVAGASTSPIIANLGVRWNIAQRLHEF